MASLLDQLLKELAGDPSLSGGGITGGLSSLLGGGGAQSGAGLTGGAQAPEDSFSGAKSLRDFLGGAVNYGARHDGQNLVGLAGGRGKAIARPGGLEGAASGLESIQGPGEQAGMFVNRKAGSANEGLVGQLMQLEDGRKASVYYDRRGKRKVNVWPGAQSGTAA